MSTLSIKSRNTKSAAPKKGSAQSKTASRRKVTSPAANAKKPTRSVESKAERVAAAKTLRKAGLFCSAPMAGFYSAVDT
jgi:hypothetical protein